MLFKILVFLTLFSCGKSPFLNEKSISSSGNSDEFTDTVSFNQIERSLRDSRGVQLLNSDYELKGIWQIGPNLERENRLILIINDIKGERVDLPFEFDIYLWMPGMGHGSFPVSIRKLDIGVYEIRDIFFTMGGYWDLHIGFKYNSELISEVLWPIDL